MTTLLQKIVQRNCCLKTTNLNVYNLALILEVHFIKSVRGLRRKLYIYLLVYLSYLVLYILYNIIHILYYISSISFYIVYIFLVNIESVYADR